MNYDALLILILESIIALLILYFSRVLRNPKHIIGAALIIGIAFTLRGLFLSHETLDYQDFLSVWVQYFSDQGGWKAIAHPIGNYNIPYMYFLALFSYCGIRDLYLIKLLSILFDIFLAWAVMRIVEDFNGSRTRRFLSFIITLLLPTVLLNGSYWGQCDSIYVALALWGLDFALRNKPTASMILFACSFAFKLQAVFILPVIIVLLIRKKYKWWHLLVFPATYLVLILPAVCAGYPMEDAVLLYFNQADTVGSGLNYNSPSVFSLLQTVPNADFAGKIGIVAAFAVVLIICILEMVIKPRSSRSLFGTALVFSIAIPFLLPHMHERYFFMADVITLTTVFISPGYFILPLLSQFASLLGYHAYLRGYYLYPMSYGGLALLAAIFISFVFYSASKNK